jgi:cyclopropane-fatty-acyl-phospholipid synthase
MVSPNDRTQANDRFISFAFGIAEKLRFGELTIKTPDGAVQQFKGVEDGPAATIQLKSSRAIRRFVVGGSLGFAEAYLDGDWDSPDLPRLLELLALNEGAYSEHFYGRGWFRWFARLRHMLRPNSRSGSRRNILAHYDLGNEFYKRWLDPSMTYSSAIFDSSDLSLENAQRAKYESLARKLSLQPDHHLLEVGCGWGGFAEFAAREVGTKITAITISEEQHAFASARIQTAGLNDKVDVRLQDYRDVDGQYDRIASIEMFEAVGESYWPIYFGKLRDALTPNGLAGLQIITIADPYFETYRRGADFIQRYVFPGGMLPSPGALQDQIERAGLNTVSQKTFGLDYAKTLATWNRRFQEAWPDILQLGFDQRFKRLWQYYLASCEVGFKVGWTDVCQLSLRRI